MFWRRNYSPLATDDSDAARTGSISLPGWGSLPRRVRTTLFATLFLVLLGLLFVNTPALQDRVRQFTYDTAEPALAKCNCSAVQDNGKNSIPQTNKVASEKLVQWSDFAYVQYVTSE